MTTYSNGTGMRLDRDELLQLVTFSLGNEEFGVDILKVREIIRMMTITRVPNAPAWVEGVINLRGKVIPVIDLRKRFGLPRQECDDKTRIIVFEIGKTTTGFVVDGVSEVLRVPSGTVEEPPAIIGGVGSEYIRGVGKLDNRLLILLELDKVLDAQELTQLSSGQI